MNKFFDEVFVVACPRQDGSFPGWDKIACSSVFYDQFTADRNLKNWKNFYKETYKAHKVFKLHIKTEVICE